MENNMGTTAKICKTAHDLKQRAREKELKRQRANKAAKAALYHRLNGDDA